jgi:phosphoribosylaminoimidazolecarboxamide formyltransferase/IMP cyclohydrolase
MLVCNFLPAAEPAPGDLDKMADRIDVGGPAMVRAAAKNYASVIPVVSPADYDSVVSVLRMAGGRPDGVGVELRRRLAAKAFAALADLDGTISRLLHDTGAEVRIPQA